MRSPAQLVDEVIGGRLVRYSAYNGILYLWHDGKNMRGRLIQNRQIVEEPFANDPGIFEWQVGEMLSKL